MMKTFTGTGASSGVAIGPTLVITRERAQIGEVEDPALAFAEAVSGVVVDLNALSTRAAEAGREEAAAVLGAQAMMADDPMLADSVAEQLEAGADLQTAIETSAATLSAMLAALDDEYLAARSADVLEAATRVVDKLAGVESDALGSITEPCIIVAPTLTAAETSQLDPGLVLGFVTEEGGATSHVAVIARSLDIPAVVGLADATTLAVASSTMILDGSTGEVVVAPNDDTIASFEQRRAAEEQTRLAADAFRGVSITFDGAAFSVPANVGGPEDVSRAVEAGADGIGLYRTEVLFLDRDEPPSESEQEAIYREALESFTHPVVVRTLDIGGDKPAPYLDTPEEENPFLGERGVRIYPVFADLFRTQVRALLRASNAGDLWIMIPMIATVADFLDTKAVIDEEADKLRKAGVELGSYRVGVMIEVPSAALLADRLAEHAEFFSIGTNDLTQYTMAADRMNGRLAQYSDPAHPAVLELCRLTALGASRHGVTVSVCGEAASDPTLSPVFAAMGITKLSVAAPRVNRVKAQIAAVDVDRARRAMNHAVEARDADEVRRLVGSMDLLDM